MGDKFCPVCNDEVGFDDEWEPFYCSRCGTKLELINKNHETYETWTHKQLLTECKRRGLI